MHFGFSGLSKPVLNLNKDTVLEGEELTATCVADGETGSIFFHFYEGSTEIMDMQSNSNQAEAKLRFSSFGNHTIHCAYTVVITPYTFKSNESNNRPVSVQS